MYRKTLEQGREALRDIPEQSGNSAPAPDGLTVLKETVARKAYEQAQKDVSGLDKQSSKGDNDFTNKLKEDRSLENIRNNAIQELKNSGLKPASLDNIEARKWYLKQEAEIPNRIDKSLSLENQAKQAFNLRNQYRTQARELMADRELAESLYNSDPNLTWEQIIQKQIDKGKTGDEIYKAIIDSSQRSRKSVNELLGL